MCQNGGSSSAPPKEPDAGALRYSHYEYFGRAYTPLAYLWAEHVPLLTMHSPDDQATDPRGSELLRERGGRGQFSEVRYGLSKANMKVAKPETLLEAARSDRSAELHTLRKAEADLQHRLQDKVFPRLLSANIFCCLSSISPCLSRSRSHAGRY